MAGQVKEEVLIRYVFIQRIVPFVLLLICTCSGTARVPKAVLVLFAGACFGICAAGLVYCWRFQGLALGLLGAFPQIIFYILSFYFLDGLELIWENVRKRKTIMIFFAVLFFFMGILSESYINVRIIKNFLQFF